MSRLHYIYISDQGRVFDSHDEPTTEDFEYAAVGMVTIVRIADASYHGVGRKWCPIPAGRLITTSIEGEETPPFHALESFCDETIAW